MASTIPVLLTSALIKARIISLSSEIDCYYRQKKLEKPLMIVVILKGSTIFYSDLVRTLKTPSESEFISVSSYGNNTESSGQVRFELDTRNSITDRDVLIIEDIIDTGNTLSVILEQFKARKPKSLEIVTLLSKPSRRVKNINVRWIGFSIEDKFVIGYGLDYAERFRELPYIGVMPPTLLKTYSSSKFNDNSNGDDNSDNDNKKKESN